MARLRPHPLGFLLSHCPWRPVLLASLFVLSACGQRGDLTLPPASDHDSPKQDEREQQAKR